MTWALFRIIKLNTIVAMATNLKTWRTYWKGELIGD